MPAVALHKPVAVGIVLASLIASAAGLAAGEANTPHQITPSPELSEEVLINPGAGWQFKEVWQPLKNEATTMPEIGTFYVRAYWTAFESAPGKYDTPLTRQIDQWLEYGRTHGRYVALRVVTYSVGSKEGCVPEYVFQAGAKRFKQPDGSGAWVPVFWDKTYLDCHEKLVEWMGNRWGKHPNLAYVDIPGGNWGEMNLTNTGIKQLDDLSLWKENGLTPEVWDAMIHRLTEMYRKNFPGKLLVCAGAYSAYGTKDTVPWVVSKGVGFRDDGLGMDYCTAGRKNRMFEKYWKDVLCVYEQAGDNENWSDAGKAEATLNWAIGQTHASIIDVGKKAYFSHKDLLSKFGRELGYHFAVQQASYYNRATKGQPFNLALQVSNSGNVPVYFDCKLEISFVDDAGHVLGQEYADVTPPIREWLPGAPIQATAAFKVPGNLQSVPARLCIGIVNAAIPEQRLQLPLKNSAGDRRYVLGPVTIQGAVYQGGAPAQAETTAAAPPPPAIDAKTLEPWDARLVERVVQGVKDGQHAIAFVKVFGAKDERVKIVAADAKALTFEMEGNTLPPIPWQKLDTHDRLNVAASFLKDDSGADHLLVAVFELANHRSDVAADHLAKAQLCDPKPDAALLAQVRALTGAR